MQFRKASYISLVLIAVASVATSILCVMNISGDIRLFKTKLSISFENNNFEYDGTEITEDQINYELLDGSLAYGDELKIALNQVINKAGTYFSYSAISYKIVNTKGYDVTESYDITTTYKDIVVSKRKVYFTSSDAAFTFSSSYFIFDSAFLTGGSLASRETYVFSDFKQFYYIGTYQNSFNVKCYNIETGENTTTNYDIHKEYGVVMCLKGE